MANITKSAVIGFDTISATNGGLRISELFAGEALAKGDLVRIHSDGLVMQAVTTTTEMTTTTASIGFVLRDYAIGQPVTIFGQGNVIEYAAGMTPGVLLFASATAGLIGDTRVLATDKPVARVLSATNIQVL